MCTLCLDDLNLEALALPSESFDDVAAPTKAASAPLSQLNVPIHRSRLSEVTLELPIPTWFAAAAR